MPKQPLKPTLGKVIFTNAKPPTKSSAAIGGSKEPSFLTSTIIPLPPRTIGGIRDQTLKLKKCNCKRSSCLKLYCECFSSGIFCNETCCCLSCKNVEFPLIIDDGEESYASESNKNSDTNRNSKSNSNKKAKTGNSPRMDMIQTVLERNQHAFRPKATNIATSHRGNEAQGQITVSGPNATAAPLRTFESRAKKTTLGCNCRKSACLKKYCECFQSQLYCMATCRCTACQNHIGNEKRENIVKKLRKKEEEKESLALAAFAISGHASRGAVGVGGNGTMEKGGGGEFYAEMPDVSDIGGVKSKIVAMVSAGVSAAGVDVFMPPSSYARVMVLKKAEGKGENIGTGINNGGDEGTETETERRVPEIAFGMVGRQAVGGVRVKEEGGAEAISRQAKIEPCSTAQTISTSGTRPSSLPAIPPVDKSNMDSDDIANAATVAAEAIVQAVESSSASQHALQPQLQQQPKHQKPFEESSSKVRSFSPENWTKAVDEISQYHLSVKAALDRVDVDTLTTSMTTSNEQIPAAVMTVVGPVDGDLSDSNRTSKPISSADIDILSYMNPPDKYSRSKKTEKIQLVDATMNDIMKNVIFLKRKMDSAGIESREEIERILKKKNGTTLREAVRDENNPVNEKSSADVGDQKHPNEIEEDGQMRKNLEKDDGSNSSGTDTGPPRASLSNASIRSLCSLVSQDTALYMELSRMMREKTLELSRLRREREQNPC